MVPSVQTKIWMTLRSRVESIALDPSITAPLPVMWPGQTTQLPSGRSLEVFNLIARPARQFIGSDEPYDRRGILQISLLSPLTANEYAETVAQEIAGTIAAHFPADLRLTYGDVTVRIYEAPEVGTSFKDEQRSRVVTPVSMRWRCYA